jgi:hypothetical protein
VEHTCDCALSLNHTAARVSTSRSLSVIKVTNFSDVSDTELQRACLWRFGFYSMNSLYTQ